jgi:putative drug exporter of the RND superfamily
MTARAPRRVRPVARILVDWWWVVLAGWALLTATLLLLAPAFDEVAVFDDSAYLPPDSAAQRGQDLLEEGWPGDTLTGAVTVAFIRADGPLRDPDAAVARAVVDYARSADAPTGLGTVTTHLDDPQLADVLTSADGQAWLVQIGLDVPPFSPEGAEAVRTLRTQVAELPAPPGLERYVTGAPAVGIDEDAAIEDSVERTTVLTVLLVMGLLLWIFRSPVAMLVPLVTVGTAYVVALAVVGLLAQAFLEVSYLFQTFGIVIIFGAGTDYSLLMMTRYAEDLGDVDLPAVAPQIRLRTLAATLTVLAGALLSAAGSTIVGFSAQSVARFGLFRTMGPALAIAVAITLLAGLTLTPALMRAFGGILFWPERWRRPPASARPADPAPVAGDRTGDGVPDGVVHQ